MPLTELNIESKTNIHLLKTVTNNNNGLVTKENIHKSERVPGRIKRFNSVVQQPQLVTKEKAK